jgi:DNA-binding response OmpR family regulator
MSTSQKKVIVVSDNDGLARAIHLNLKAHFEADVVLIAPDLSDDKENLTSAGDCDLIIVATSSPTSEPVVALAKASLTDRVGQVPLLIISDRPFDSDLDARIVHLDFPFTLGELHSAVQDLLPEESDAALANAYQPC